MPSLQTILSPRVVIWFSSIALLIMAGVLLIAFLNPRLLVTQDASHEEPVLHLSIDTSASMYQHRDAVKDFLNELADWPGKLRVQTFSTTLNSVKLDDQRELTDLVEGWVKSPTLFSPLQENLLFRDQEHYHMVVSDFLFRDGFSQIKVAGSQNTNLFYFSPGMKSVHTSKAAVFILNQENRIFPDGDLSGDNGTYPLKLLFYSGEPSQDLRYRIYYQTPQMRNQNTDKKTLLQTAKITTKSYYHETEVELSLPTKNEDWVQVGVEILGDGYPDRINLLPPRKKIVIQLVYFKINREAFAIKNSLDRYQDYQTETLYLARMSNPDTWKNLERQFKALLSKRNLFILVSPPSHVLKWFREKKVAFIHLPSTPSNPNSFREGKRIVDELDFTLPPIDFLGERTSSEARWKEAASKLRVLPIPITKGDISFHQSGGKSAFFLRGREMYWGIQNLFFLNDNVLQEGERSYWDVFLLEAMDFFQEKVGEQFAESTEVSHNFFLGEKVSGEVIGDMPHVISVGDAYHITPEISRAGLYSSSRNLPPYNYRIPLEEYFPPPHDSNLEFASFNSSRDREEFLNWMASLKNRPIPQVEREIDFRDLPIYGHLLLLMIGIFLILLGLKWYDLRKTLG